MSIPAPRTSPRLLVRLAPFVAASLLAAAPALAQSTFTSFFATSVGNGASGGDYGGLAGADARCANLAGAVGLSDRTWRAYLSTVPIEGFGGELVNARDRIGAGPWFNSFGEQVADGLDDLHENGIDPARIVDETGASVPGNEHDILTGSDPDGFALTSFPGNPAAPGPTCFNWTTSDSNAFAWVGHSDWDPGDSWNSSHGTQCDPAGLAATAGSGRIYCFAPDAPIPPPTNDACEDASEIPETGPFPFADSIDTSVATSDLPVASCGPPGADASVWYRFTPPRAGTVRVATAGSDYGAVISVWPAVEGCGSLQTELACDDDPVGSGALVELVVAAGAEILIQVADRDGSGGGALAVELGFVASGGNPAMSFFVTSTGNGASGGDYGGLEGADARCQSLAATAGAGNGTWQAYLSTAPIQGFGGALVDARDRIGTGPWRNFDGDVIASDVDALHTDGLDPARALDEYGDPVPSIEHDILTGSFADGTARDSFPGNPSAPPPNCFNWTTNDPNAFTWVGHSDDVNAWSSAHETTCDEAGLNLTAGTGRLYCFQTVPEATATTAALAALISLLALGSRRQTAANL